MLKSYNKPPSTHTNCLWHWAVRRHNLRLRSMLGFVNPALRVSRTQGAVNISLSSFSRLKTRNVRLPGQISLRNCGNFHSSPSQLPNLTRLTRLSLSTTRRSFQHIAPKPDSPPPPPNQPLTLGGEPEIVSQAEQRRSDWTVIIRLLENVWPKNDWKTRGTVILGFGLLITGKVCYSSW